MDTVALTLSPSEFISGCLIGDYGANNLLERDGLLSSAFDGVLSDKRGAMDVEITLGISNVYMNMSSRYSDWHNLVIDGECRLERGELVCTIISDLLERYFMTELAYISSDNYQQYADIFDLIVQHLVYYDHMIDRRIDVTTTH